MARLFEVPVALFCSTQQKIIDVVKYVYMKIAIISDTHDNLATLKKAIDWINKNGIEQIIHCGDIASFETLQELSGLCAGEIQLVFGNLDDDYSLSETLKNHPLANVIAYRKIGAIDINGKKIAFTHFPRLAEDLAKGEKYDIVFYGHTHKPWEEKVDSARLINPGNLAGQFYKSSFATYDTATDQLELKILENL